MILRLVLGWVARRYADDDRRRGVRGEWSCPDCGARVTLVDGDAAQVAAALDDARAEHRCTSPDPS